MSEPISVITVLKNRFINFTKCVEFLHRIEDLNSVEHVVVDFQSNDGDINSLYNRGLRHKHIVIDRPFSINCGRNIGVKNATHEKIFICDADIIVAPNLVGILNDLIKKGQAYFPVVRDMSPDFDMERFDAEILIRGKLGRWRNAGYGMSGFMRDDFIKCNGFDEITFKAWGGDDVDFYKRMRKHFTIIRNRKHPFLHIYHPRTKTFLNKHYDREK